MIIRTWILILTGLSLLIGSGAAQPAPRAENQVQTNPPPGFLVEFFPVAPYHVGDILSARVTYTIEEEIGGQEITIALAEQPDQQLKSAVFSQFSRQAVFYWFLDTGELEAGFVNFQFTLPDTGFSWTAGVQLLPDPGDRQAGWAETRSACCTLHYLSGTDAAADLAEITAAVENRTAMALAQFAAAGVFDDSPIDEPLGIVLIPIVVGHGGFATDEAVLTYSQRNWAGIEFETLIHHEVVHVIDRLVNTTGPRPSLFVEGIAVYLSGGHYRAGDPLQRAAALLALDLYLPITEIADDFYAAQHEIGYMEAAALVAYLDALWGWETFIDFYFNLPEGPSDSAIIASALETRFGLSLAELEENFIAYLQSLDQDPEVEADVRLTVETYDTLRRYQTLAIPSAHFRSAWWPPVRQMRENGVVGDYAYREKAPLNVILEDYFIAVHADLGEGEYARADETLTHINTLLTIVEDSGGTLSHYTIGWPVHAHPGWQRFQ